MVKRLKSGSASSCFSVGWFGTSQTEPFSGNITPRQIGEFSMINPHMTIGVKDPGAFGFLRHPLLCQSVAPALSEALLRAELGNLLTQGAHFGDAMRVPSTCPILPAPHSATLRAKEYAPGPSVPELEKCSPADRNPPALKTSPGSCSRVQVTIMPAEPTVPRHREHL